MKNSHPVATMTMTVTKAKSGFPMATERTSVNDSNYSQMKTHDLRSISGQVFQHYDLRDGNIFSLFEFQCIESATFMLTMTGFACVYYEMNIHEALTLLGYGTYGFSLIVLQVIDIIPDFVASCLRKQVTVTE